MQLSRHTDTCMVHVGSWLRGSGALAAEWLLRCMGGVWVTPEATALTNTTVAGVHVSVWRKRSGATAFWRADADFLSLGRCAGGLIGGCSAGGREAGVRSAVGD